MSRRIMFLIIGLIMLTVCFTVFVGCGSDKIDDQHSTGNHTTSVVTPITVIQALQANPTNVNNFVKEVVDEVTFGHKDSDVIYLAYDIEDKNANEMDNLKVALTTKGEGNERTYEVKNAKFKAVTGLQLRDGEAVLEDLIIEDEASLTYDDSNFERYAAIYTEQHDGVIKEFKGNEFSQNSYQATIVSTDDLLAEYANAANTFGNKIAKAVLNHYSYNNEDVIFCGYDFPDADSLGRINGITLRVAAKTGENERTVSDYKVVFDNLYLDDIANGTFKLSGTKISLSKEATYDPKTVEDVESLYADYDGAYIAYNDPQAENPEVNPPVQDLTMNQILADYQDVVNENLETHYDNTLRKAFGRKYQRQKDYVTGYQWDLGEVNDNNEVQHAKLTFKWQDDYDIDLGDKTLHEYAATIYVYNVDFVSPLCLSDLLDATKVSSVMATYSQEYTFSYDYSIQGTRTELVNVILQNTITDGLDYQKAEIVFKDTGSSTTSELGVVETFVVLFFDGESIKAIYATIQTSNSDAGLIAKLQAGKGSTLMEEKVTFTENMLNKVILEKEAEL